MTKHKINKEIINISVVMSVYNNIEYIDAAVNSILTQSFEKFEFIIIDDCSTDGSREKLIDYAKQDSRIKLVLNEKNKGLTKNLNYGIEIAQGKYIARMDGDDIAAPTRFEEQYQHMEANPNVVLIGSGYYTIDNHSKRYRLTLDSYDTLVTRWLCVFTPPLMHPCSMYRKTLIEQGLKYNENAFPAEDFDFWSRIIREGDCFVIPKALIDYRLHDNNISATRRIEQLQRTKEIVNDNLHYYFGTDLVTQKEYEHLLNYLYSDAEFTYSDVVKSVSIMRKLMAAFASEYKVTTSQKRQIEMLGTRRIVKSIARQKTKKAIKLFALLPMFKGLFYETLAYRKRHQISKI